MHCHFPPIYEEPSEDWKCQICIKHEVSIFNWGRSVLFSLAYRTVTPAQTNYYVTNGEKPIWSFLIYR